MGFESCRFGTQVSNPAGIANQIQRHICGSGIPSSARPTLRNFKLKANASGRMHAIRTLTQIAEKHAGVYIKTGERTFFEDILRPVLDSFSHALREH